MQENIGRKRRQLPSHSTFGGGGVASKEGKNQLLFVAGEKGEGNQRKGGEVSLNLNFVERACVIKKKGERTVSLRLEIERGGGERTRSGLWSSKGRASRQTS